MRTHLVRRTILGMAALAVAIALVGCGSAASPAQSPAVVGTTPQPPAATAAPTPASSGQPTTTGQRVTGTVQSVVAGKITLTDGNTLTLDPNTQVIRVQPATAADLQPQDYVAITAAKQQDGTLLASMINIFAESQRGVGAGQRPLPGDNLMTNATIASVNGDTFTATFPGGNATVKLAPDAKIAKFVQAAPTDITSGSNVSALVVNGVVRAITLQ